MTFILTYVYEAQAVGTTLINTYILLQVLLVNVTENPIFIENIFVKFIHINHADQINNIFMSECSNFCFMLCTSSTRLSTSQFHCYWNISIYRYVYTTPEERMRVAQGFFTRWNFPNCLGAIDGKHILIRPPQDSGSYIFNCKGNYRIVLLAVCDANLEFLYVDIGANGRVSDGEVWSNSALCHHIATNTACLLTDGIVQGSDRILPYVFVADDAFQLQRRIMKPFAHKNQTRQERIFHIDFPGLDALLRMNLAFSLIGLGCF